MNLRAVMTRDISDEYELEQLVPVYSKNDGRRKDVEPSQDQTEKLTDKLSASAELKLRCAVFEAIVDEIVEDKIEETVEENNYPDTNEIEQEVQPVVEAAETLRLIPRFPKGRLQAIIASHLKYATSPMYHLASKSAHFCAGVMADIDKEDLTAGEVVAPDDTTDGEIHEDNDLGVDEDKLVDSPQDSVEAANQFGEGSESFRFKSIFEDVSTPVTNDIISENDEVMVPPDPISEEVVEMEPGEGGDEDVTVDPVLPESAAMAVRYLAASAINHRKATAIMSRRVSGRILREMLHELRYRLPKDFCKKYGISQQ